ncbi:hypothetical protein GQ43DRAFT_472992 [Delitschia confertaspora ATCC 74209]|uniref:Uncharacterized protein n=1 Tax=Delitschia confertaspora ATCC 74209 TaxID=1513339 RepID=A0A9P4JN25_9PLEO|nr:hypothetical protein GQ43DRAFT_472992 [Delitschia confertaspora ATCC 74209]
MDDEKREHTKRPVKRHIATVFDATAGRISQDGFIQSRPAPSSKYSDHLSTATQPIRPDEVLFKQRNAPPRYQETDYYYANSKLNKGSDLPSSDLVKALHSYIAENYSKSSLAPSNKIWKSMDETALLALGILVEETASSVLGETGDLAFLEAGGVEEPKSLPKSHDDESSSGPED